jgi:cardiolipin synthase
MNAFSIITLLYILAVAAVCLRVLFSIHSSNKTMAYLMLCIFLPVAGMAFYLVFGINYWKKKRYAKKFLQDMNFLRSVEKEIPDYRKTMVDTRDKAVLQNAELAAMLVKDLGSPLTKNNKVKILVNGDEKFPELLDALQNAKQHIHLEYYIYEYDEIGTQLIEILLAKAKQGVKVRFIYDDFGSPTIKRKTEKRMRDAGMEIYPFHKVRFYLLANRFNYRNHKKIVIIDGCTAFVGGINVSDRYINNKEGQLFWRDTHLRIDGPAIYYLQYLFISDWNFGCSNKVDPAPEYFAAPAVQENCYVQVAAGGPDSVQPSVLYSILQAIYLAQKEVLITTPYFTPGDSIMHALSIAALSGLSVKLLVPGISDSKIVNAASRSNYTELLQAGVEIYLYRKGFVHAKTIVTDGLLSIVGTANMDHRSFELNFEVNVLVYDAAVATQMRKRFFKDLEDAEKIDLKEWLSRPAYAKLPEKIARLLSPVL